MKVLIIGAGAMPAHYFVPEIRDNFILAMPSPGGFTIDDLVIDEYSDSLLQLAESLIETGKAAERAASEMADIARQLNDMCAKVDMERHFEESKQTSYKPYTCVLNSKHQDPGNFIKSGFHVSGKLARGRI